MLCISGILKAQTVAVVTNNKDGWHKIGETTVNFKTEKDEITIIGADVFKQLQLKIVDAPVYLSSMQVFFENGTRKDVNIKSDYNAGQYTAPIDLPGRNRKLKKVVFVYRTIINWPVDKAHIELWGLK